jgi:hypothetical protein
MEVSGQLYPRERAPSTHLIGGWVSFRTGLDDVERRKILPLSGLELLPLGHPACSQSLYRLLYPGSSRNLRNNNNNNFFLGATARGGFWPWFFYFLSNRSYFTAVTDVRLTTCIVKPRLSQRSIVGPILFHLLSLPPFRSSPQYKFTNLENFHCSALRMIDVKYSYVGITLLTLSPKLRNYLLQIQVLNF